MFGLSGVKSISTRLSSNDGCRRALYRLAAISSSTLTEAPELHAASTRRYKSAVPEVDQYYNGDFHNYPQHIDQESMRIPRVNGHGKKRKMQKQEPRIHINHTHLPAFETPQAQSIQNASYLSNILNARVYDVARETPLQEAKNLSAVSVYVYMSTLLFCIYCIFPSLYNITLLRIKTVHLLPF
jgi:hypothetical protein